MRRVVYLKWEKFSMLRSPRFFWTGSWSILVVIFLVGGLMIVFAVIDFGRWYGLKIWIKVIYF